jgi:GNAT superfamily N-acetyltransferase
MHIERFDPATEPAKAAACFRMYADGIPFDDPDGPPWSEHIFTSWLQEGFGKEPRETALAVNSGGNPVGAYLLEFPQARNTHIGSLLTLVPPHQRRHGYGTALLRHAAARAAANGRTLLSAETKDDAPGSAFAAAVGAKAGVLDVRRVLDVFEIPPGHLAALRRRAESAAQGYSLLSWAGPTSEEHLQDVAEVIAAMADAPRNPGEEPHRPDPQRIRDYEGRGAEMGMRRYSVVARCERTGRLAGVTELGLDSADPVWGYQFITAVAREHRGHRLGLLTKTAMLEKLAVSEPELAHILTGNADSNQHMISINDDLGYRVLDEWQSWELEVAAVI